MDYDLLEAVVKSYDHTTRVVRRLDGEVPVSISSVEMYATLYRAFEEGEEGLGSVLPVGTHVFV